MPRKKNDADQALDNDTIDDTEQEAQVIDPDQEDGDDLSAILSDLGGDSSALITVSRINRQGKREVIDRYHPADFDLFTLRDEWGGGEYVLTGRRGNRIAKGFPRRVVLAEKKEPAKPDPRQDHSLADVLRDGLQQQQEAINRLAALLVNQQSAQQQGPEELRQSLLSEMIQMKELFGNNNQQPALGAEKVLELLKTGIEFGKEAGGGDTSMMDLLKQTIATFGQPISQAMELQQRKQAAQNRHPGAQPVGSPQPINQAGQVNQESQAGQSSPGEDEMINMFKMYVGFLVKEAEQGSDPFLWADVIMSKVPEDQLRGILSQMEPIDYLGNIDNRVYSYREWFSALGDDLKKQLGITDQHVREPGNEDNGKPPIDGTAGGSALENDGATLDHPER